jgi:ABC-type transporter Mla MlaB component
VSGAVSSIPINKQQLSHLDSSGFRLLDLNSSGFGLYWIYTILDLDSSGFALLDLDCSGFGLL